MSEMEKTLKFIYSTFCILQSSEVRPREIKEFIQHHLVMHLVEQLRQDLYLLA